MIALSVATGIPASEWAREGARGIATAWDVLEEMHKQASGKGTDTGVATRVQYSG